MFTYRKTFLAQKLLEKYKYPYLSIDHLKMGVIRSGKINLTPDDDAELESYLWPIIREIIKTAIENQQNLVIEGCYIPFDWKNSFEGKYLEQIKYYCLIMTEEYINNHFDDIKEYANIIEHRIDDSFCTKEILLKENSINLDMCKKYGCDYILIDNDYKVDIKL
jgi:hypothetical protein